MIESIEDTIKTLINNELKGNYSIANLHGVDLKACLVHPFKLTFEKSFKINEFVELFVVLKEFPQIEEGYLITYNPKEKLFGLGLQRGDGDCPLLLGYFETFLEAFQGM